MPGPSHLRVRVLAHVEPVRAAGARVDHVHEAVEGAHDQMRLEHAARGEQRGDEGRGEDLPVGAHREGARLPPRPAVEHVHEPRGGGHHHLQRAVAVQRGEREALRAQARGLHLPHRAAPVAPRRDRAHRVGGEDLEEAVAVDVGGDERRLDLVHLHGEALAQPAVPGEG